MARDEMNQITQDRWDEDIWGAATPYQGFPRPRIVLFFGTDDHWVANHRRDELITARATWSGQWKPKILIDDTGIPHSFCTRELTPKSEDDSAHRHRS